MAWDPHTPQHCSGLSSAEARKRILAHRRKADKRVGTPATVCRPARCQQSAVTSSQASPRQDEAIPPKQNTLQPGVAVRYHSGLAQSRQERTRNRRILRRLGLHDLQNKIPGIAIPALQQRKNLVGPLLPNEVGEAPRRGGGVMSAKTAPAPKKKLPCSSNKPRLARPPARGLGRRREMHPHPCGAHPCATDRD